MKITEKEIRESLGFKSGAFQNEQEKFISSLVEGLASVINKSNEGNISDEVFASKLKEFSDSLAKSKNEEILELKKDLEEAQKVIKAQGENIEKLRQKGINVAPGSKFDEAITKMFESEKFNDFASGKTRKSGTFDGFALKDIVSMTDNYEGDILISQQQPTVINPFASKPLHMRDILKTLQGDPQYLTLTYTQIDSMDRNARFVSENGMLPESMISVKEKTTGVTRLGTHIRLSKRMLKSRTYIRSYVIAMLPEAVYMREDANILFGDGNGENLLGIANEKGVLSVEAIIGESLSEGKAGSIKSVTPYNDNTSAIVQFTNPHPEILDGMMITFTGAVTNTGLNATHSVIKLSDREILLLGVTMVDEEEKASVMTFKVNHGAYKSIEAPNTGDVIKTAFSVMTFGQYYPTAIILNPITVNAIECEKDAIGRNLGLITQGAGYKMIAGRPIIEYSSIPANKYLLGDFNNGAHLVDYTSLSLEWADDVECKLTNQVVLIAQEEVIFPIYMPFAFSYGDLNLLKAAITKPIVTNSSSSSSSQTVTNQTPA